jgi:L-fucose isomerase-like protein
MRSGTSTFGVVVGNRNFFPDQLIEEGRAQVLRMIEGEGHKTVSLSPEEAPYGAVETREDAERCARVFADHEESIDGIIVTLPNFGDEKAVAEALRLSGLDVPVLIHAYPDEMGKLDIGHRRDAYCGKLSLCNNLMQYGIPFSNTTLHVESPEGDTFKRDLEVFAGICRVVKGLRKARLGLVGARPSAFNTVRFSEKILEREGITVETVDLSEIIVQAQRSDSADAEVKRELERIKDSIATEGIPEASLQKMAKLLVVLSRWVEDNGLDAVAVQCWTALEEIYGIVPCTAMSLLSEDMIPSACEADIMGALSMYTLALAAQSPAALVDWNNNFSKDENKVITFHCSNFPTSYFTCAEMSFQEIIAGEVGKENTYGTCVGRISPGPATFFRLSSDDLRGRIASYLAEGEYTDDEVHTFGGYGVAEIENLEELMRFIVERGFEHHVAVVKGHVGAIVNEAIGKYLSWDLYNHTCRR